MECMEVYFSRLRLSNFRQTYECNESSSLRLLVIFTGINFTGVFNYYFWYSLDAGLCHRMFAL